MKKTLLSFVMLTYFGIYNSQGQITINSSNVVDLGDAVQIASDTLGVGITIGASGTNQTWDFSTVSEHELDTLYFQDPASLAGNGNFSSSNMGMIETNEDSAYYFITKNSSILRIDGSYVIEDGEGITFPVESTIITFPSTMGTNYSESWNGILLKFFVGQFGVDSVKVTRDSETTSIIDGWGDVTTPLGTFASLRQSTQENNIDTTWIYQAGSWSIIDAITAASFGFDPIAYDTTRTAIWWSNDPSVKFPVIEMDYKADGSIYGIDWLKATPNPLGIDQTFAEEKEVVLYPNPALNNITIATKLINNSRIKIYDVTGKLVASEQFNKASITLSVSDFNNGLYFYNINDVNRNVLYANKFVVAK